MTLPMEKPKKGMLLIAEPFLGDASFERSVVLITDHNADGTVGFVLNRPLDLRIEQVLDSFPSYNPELYYGGPVQKNNLYYLHSKGALIPDSVEVFPGMYWGGKINAIKELLATGLLKEDEIKFFLGYSGWGKDQLLVELHEKSWILAEPTLNLLSTDPKTLWKELILGLGGDYLLWANAPIDPILN